MTVPRATVVLLFLAAGWDSYATALLNNTVTQCEYRDCYAAAASSMLIVVTPTVPYCCSHCTDSDYELLLWYHSLQINHWLWWSLQGLMRQGLLPDLRS